MARAHTGGRVPQPHHRCTRGSRTPPRPRPPLAKLVVVGGAGAGKSTMVGAVSEIGGPTVDAAMSTAPGRSTTVAMDFGRATVDGRYVYLFGTPGQPRFRYTWDRLARGAGGALLVADPRRLNDSAAARGFLARRRLPFAGLVNLFDGTTPPPDRRVRDALALTRAVPVLYCDPRSRTAARRALVDALARLRAVVEAAPASVPPRLGTNRCGLPLTPPN